jgi:hypothetical protein
MKWPLPLTVEVLLGAIRGQGPKPGVSPHHVRRAVEPPEALDRCTNEPLDLVGPSDVHRHELRRTARRPYELDSLLASGGIDIAGHDRRTPLSERKRRRPPEPRARAGAKCHGRHPAGTLTRLTFLRA